MTWSEKIAREMAADDASAWEYEPGVHDEGGDDAAMYTSWNTQGNRFQIILHPEPELGAEPCICGPNWHDVAHYVLWDYQANKVYRRFTFDGAKAKARTIARRGREEREREREREAANA